MATTPSSLPSAGPANGAPPLPTSVPLTPNTSFEDQIRAALTADQPAAVDIPATPQTPSAALGAPPVVPATPESPSTPPLEEFDFDSQEEPPPTDPAAAAAAAPVVPGETPATPAPDAAATVKELLAKETWTPEEEDRIRGAFLKTNNGKAMLDAKNFWKSLEAAPEIDPQTGLNKGGIGRRPSKEEILQGDTDSLAMMQLMHDFETRPSNFLANFFGHRDPQSGQLQLRPGADNIIQSLPQHLLQADPSGQLHQRLATVAIAPYLEKIRSTVVEMPQATQAQAEQKLRRGQALNDLELTLFGEFTPIPGFDYGAGPHDPSKPDPLAADRQRLADQQRQIQDQQRQAQQSHYEGVANTIEAQIETSVRQDAIRILSQGGLKNAYPEAVFNGLVDQFILEVFERTSGNPRQGANPANPRAFQAFNIQIDRAARGRLDRITPVTTYRRMAQEVMRNSARPYLEKVIAKAQAGSDALHQRAAASASRSEVPPGSAPAGAPPAASAPNANSLIRPAGADPDKWMEETIRTQMLGGAAAAAIRH